MILVLLACTPAPGSAGGSFTADTGHAEDSGGSDSAGETGMDSGEDSASDSGADTGVAYAEGDGPYAVEESGGKVGGRAVTWFFPAGADAAPVVIWSHGTSRSKAQHVDAARHAASWGLVVVTPDLPVSFGGHEENAAFLTDDLLPEALARGEANGKWAFVGHSAGGLASFLAAADVGADAVVGLDAVDAEDLGAEAAPSIVAPVLRLVGEPSACNASGNAREWAPGGTDWMVAVPGASHCDFESPTDGICTMICGANDAGRQDVVGEYATAWLVHHLLGGADAWIGGSEFDDDERAGRVE